MSLSFNSRRHAILYLTPSAKACPVMNPIVPTSVLAVALATGSAMAQTEPAGPVSRAPELHLEAQARSLVDNDLMTVVMGVEAEGPRLQELSQRVLATLQKAAARARDKPGIDVRVGSLGTQPVWGPKGRTGQWQVRGSVTLSSTDVPALGLLASELTADMQVSAVNFSLSRTRSDEVESQLMTQVAAAFQRKAQAMASALGFKGYAIQSVTLAQGGSTPPPAPVLMRGAMAAAEAGAVPIPAESGKTEVVVTMSGTVALR